MSNAAASLVACVAIALLPFASALPDSARVRIDSGDLVGTLEEGVAVFRGIPYALPPVGELRWRPPQPVGPWQSARDSSRFGHACPQKRGAYPEWVDAHIDEIGQSEDCLTLNIWTPLDRNAKPLPVMVYIHGGNMQFGAGSIPVYDGSILARQGVVLITINYRVG